jgi:hypothetical protein
MNSVYTINKGINRPITFKGLKAQYIGYLGIGIATVLVLFAVLYISGVNMFLCLGLTFLLGTLLFAGVYKLSDTYGQHGLLKKLALRNIPPALRSSSRRLFIQLKK